MRKAKEKSVLAALRARSPGRPGSLPGKTTQELVVELGLDRGAVLRRLKDAIDAGEVECVTGKMINIAGRVSQVPCWRVKKG